MEMETILKWIGFVPSKIHWFLMRIAKDLGMNDSLATRVSPLIYWISVLLLIWISISMLEKVNSIVKFILFILIAVLIIGFFVPVW